MKLRFLVALVTVIVFVGGFFTGRWTELHKPLPPPPGNFGWEFSRGSRSGQPPSGNKPINREQLIARVEAIKPQLDDFRTKRDAIDAEFEKNLDPILTADQRTHRADRQKRKGDGRDQKGGKDDIRPLSDDRLTYLLREAPSQTILFDVIIPFHLERLTRELKLDADQQEKVRALLKTRRSQIFDLVDSSPPPSVMLSRIVPLIQRIAQPAPAPKATPPAQP